MPENWFTWVNQIRVYDIQTTLEELSTTLEKTAN
jgi:hypothetical protein